MHDTLLSFPCRQALLTTKVYTKVDMLVCRNTTLNTCLEASSVQTAFDALGDRVERKRPGLFRRAHAASTQPAASDSATSDSLASTSVQGSREATAMQDERPAETPEQQSASYSAQEASSSAAAAASHSQGGEHGRPSPASSLGFAQTLGHNAFLADTQKQMSGWYGQQ